MASNRALVADGSVAGAANSPGHPRFKTVGDWDADRPASFVCNWPG